MLFHKQKWAIENPDWIIDSPFLLGQFCNSPDSLQLAVQCLVEDITDFLLIGDAFQNLDAVYPKVRHQAVFKGFYFIWIDILIQDLNFNISVFLILFDQFGQHPVSQRAVRSPGRLDICYFFHWFSFLNDSFRRKVPALFRYVVIRGSWTR